MKKYLPRNIDLERLIEDSGMSHIKRFHPDKLVWLLSEIAEKLCNPNGYAEIHSKRFQSFVHNYKDYLNCLDTSGVIEQDLSFSHELYSKVRSYKFIEEYSSTITAAEINYLPIVKKAAKEKERKLKTCQGNQHLVKWFSPSLTIDYDAAIDYLGTYYSEVRKERQLMAEKEKPIRNTWYEDYSIKCLELQWCETKDPYESNRRAFINLLEN